MNNTTNTLISEPISNNVLSICKAELRLARENRRNRHLTPSQRTESSRKLAQALSSCAKAASRKALFEEAEHYLDQAVRIFRPVLAADRRSGNGRRIKESDSFFREMLKELADLRIEIGHISQAAAAYRQLAREIRNGDEEEMDLATVLELAQVLKEASRCYQACHETDLALKTSLEARNNLEIAWGHSRNPEELRHLCRMTEESTELLRKVGDYRSAAEMAERAVSLSNRCFTLSGEERDAEMGIRNLMRTASILQADQRLDQAASMLDLAASIAGQMETENPDFVWLKASILVQKEEADSAHKNEEERKAMQAAAETPERKSAAKKSGRKQAVKTALDPSHPLPAIEASVKTGSNPECGYPAAQEGFKEFPEILDISRFGGMRPFGPAAFYGI